MSEIESAYSDYLKFLRVLAEEQNIAFVDVLIAVTKAYERRPGLYLCNKSSPRIDEIKELEETLIAEFRVRYYELKANSNLEGIRSVFDELKITALQIDAKTIKKAKAVAKNVMTANEQLVENLTLGRQKGSSKNQKRASVIRSYAGEINAGLLANPISARWTIDRRSKYIEAKLTNSTVEIDGKHCRATMVNGKPYSSQTIGKWIQGS